MDALEEDLRATSDAIAHDAERLRVIELQKGRLAPDDPRTLALAEEAQAIGARLARATAAEEELTGLAAEDARGPA
jgi:hypothetical protein